MPRIITDKMIKDMCDDTRFPIQAMPILNVVGEPAYIQNGITGLSYTPLPIQMPNSINSLSRGLSIQSGLPEEQVKGFLERRINAVIEESKVDELEEPTSEVPARGYLDLLYGNVLKSEESKEELPEEEREESKSEVPARGYLDNLYGDVLKTDESKSEVPARGYLDNLYGDVLKTDESTVDDYPDVDESTTSNYLNLLYSSTIGAPYSFFRRGRGPDTKPRIRRTKEQLQAEEDRIEKILDEAAAARSESAKAISETERLIRDYEETERQFGELDPKISPQGVEEF